MKSYYIGLDISNQETSICILDEAGNIVKELISQSTPQDIARAIRSTGYAVTAIGLETGCMSDWITGELRKCFDADVSNGLNYWRVLCLNSFKVAKLLGMNINKTDQNDARMIAEVVRISCFSKQINLEVYSKSPDSRQIRSLIKIRQNNVRRRLSVYNEIRGTLKSFGIILSTASPSEFCVMVKDTIQGLPPYLVIAITSSLNIYESLNKEVDILTKSIEEIADKNEDVQRLTLLPGVGSLTALHYVATIEDPNRFKDSKDVGAYLGLTSSQCSSGEQVKMLGISKRGDPILRSLLFEAATVILYRTKRKSALKEWGHKLEKKLGSKKARVALARRLAVIMLEIFKTKQPFIEPTKTSKRKRVEHALTTEELQILLDLSKEKGSISARNIKELKPLTASCTIR